MRYRGILVSNLLGTLLLVLTAASSAQEVKDYPHDHSCTVSFAYIPRVWPVFDEGDIFNPGWGLQAGGGFAISHPVEAGSGVRWFLTGNYMYTKLGANSTAFAAAQVANTTSAHGSFSAVTFDPTARYRLSRRVGIYGTGGFGWFRRSVGFNGAGANTLLHSGASSLDRVASNSGVFDGGAGVTFSPPHAGDFMLFAEGRFYKGLAINSASELVPLSVGVRW
jgi:hypothetical protein